MALPKPFATNEDYFEAVTTFLRDYQYLFKEANINILVSGVLDQINIENVSEIYGNPKDVFEKNQYLRDFQNKIERFTVDFQEAIPVESEIDFNAPLSPKKRHEIVYLTEEIKATCEDVNCRTVVDFGSGLGYLDQLLFKISDYDILGLECNENFHAEAKKRQRSYHAESLDKVKYANHKIIAESNEFIEKCVINEFPRKRSFCIAGLHACADLTIDALDLFLKMADCKAMVLMSCCYHKMQMKDGGFKNFPLSRSCKEVFKRKACEDFMKVPFLRLAAQPPDSKCDLKSLEFNLLARAVLELYAYRHGFNLKRRKRKAVAMRTINNDFESYLQDACTNGFTISKLNSDETYAFDKAEITKIWRQLDLNTSKRTAIFVLLQNKLQPVIENFILYDRLVYLEENGIKNCRFKRLFNVALSPRCLALIVCK